MKLPRRISYEKKYGPAMTMTEQAAADAYFEVLVQHTMTFWKRTREEAEQVERSNLGYYAGYYSHETRDRVERLFRCEHPIFGSIAKNGAPTFERLLNLGIAMGKASRERADAREKARPRRRRHTPAAARRRANGEH